LYCPLGMKSMAKFGGSLALEDRQR